LFYTTQDLETLSILRQHALHLLFSPSPPSGPENAISRNMFPFTQKPNALDRDRIQIPAGWDTWGKIGVLREGFDCRGWGDAWEYELDSQTNDNPNGAKVMYKKLVGSDDRVKVIYSLSVTFALRLRSFRNLVYPN
jgi:dynein light intermediate chain 1